MLALLALAAIPLSACTPAPEPTPTSAFASEEDAFAAAEEVYRAYNEAGNARRNGASDPNPQDYLIGTALEGDIDALRQLQEADLRPEGDVDVRTFTPREASLKIGSTQVTSVVCLDATDTRVFNNSDQDVTPANRLAIVAQAVTFTEVDGVLLISAESSAEDDQC